MKRFLMIFLCSFLGMPALAGLFYVGYLLCEWLATFSPFIPALLAWALVCAFASAMTAFASPDDMGPM